MKNTYVCDPTEDIRSTALAIGEFIGVGIEFKADLDPSRVFGSLCEVFDGRSCAAMIFLLAAAARANSKDRCLHIKSARGISGCALRFTFRIYGDGWQRVTDYLDKGVNSKRSLPMAVDKSDAELIVSVVSYYENYGFLDVKRNNTYFDPTAFEELFR